MKRSLSSVLSCLLGSETIRLDVVWQGKVKPVRYRLVEVLTDGVVLIPDEATADSAIHPFSAMHSIQVAVVHPHSAT